MTTLTQRTLLGAVPQYRSEDPDVLPLGVRGEVLEGGVGVRRQLTLGVRRNDQALDAQRHPVDLRPPRQPAEHRLDRGRRREAFLLDRSQVGGVGLRHGD